MRHLLIANNCIVSDELCWEKKKNLYRRNGLERDPLSRTYSSLFAILPLDFYVRCPSSRASLYIRRSSKRAIELLPSIIAQCQFHSTSLFVLQTYRQTVRRIRESYPRVCNAVDGYTRCHHKNVSLLLLFFFLFLRNEIYLAVIYLLHCFK